MHAHARTHLSVNVHIQNTMHMHTHWLNAYTHALVYSMHVIHVCTETHRRMRSETRQTKRNETKRNETASRTSSPPTSGATQARTTQNRTPHTAPQATETPSLLHAKERRAFPLFIAPPPCRAAVTRRISSACHDQSAGGPQPPPTPHALNSAPPGHACGAKRQPPRLNCGKLKPRA